MEGRNSPAGTGNAERGARDFQRHNFTTSDHPIDRLLARLDGLRQSGPGKWLARCPAHADRSPSLSIRETDDGRVLLHCFSGCSVHDVIAAIGLTTADLFPTPFNFDASQPRARAPRWSRGEVFDLLMTESIVLIVAVNQLLLGHDLNEADFARVVQAQNAIWRLKEATHGK